jgi:hypothetical protein
MIAKTKSEMAARLAEAMTSSYDRYRKEQKLEYDTGLLKTYLIEADVASSKKSAHSDILTFLNQLAPVLNIKVFEAEDETLFNIEHGKDGYYLDVSDARFWVLHTLALSNRADKLRMELLKSSPLLDSAWLPTQLLEKISGMGYFKGFGALHDETPFMIDDSKRTSVETMHLRLWGGVFPHSLALSSVSVKFWLKDHEDDAVIDNVTFDGKATALGKSFASHTNLITKSYSQYSYLIKRMENELAIHFNGKEQVLSLQGHPIVVSLTRKLTDIESFVSKVFSSSLPFRLWGMSELYEDGFARVYAVDLHIGHKLTFEIGEDFIRIYLPPGTCGNSIARFYTNLQQYYDSQAAISGGEYEHLF